MSTVKTTNLQHPSAPSPNLVLNADGSVTGIGLVAVKHALFTGTQTNSTAAGGNFAITSLSITHEVANASNVLLFIASIGSIGANFDYWNVGCALAVDGTLVNIGDADATRTRATAASRLRALATGINENVAPMSFSTAYTPGTGSKVYTLRGINSSSSTQVIYINRDPTDSNSSVHFRGASSLLMLEVKV